MKNLILLLIATVWLAGCCTPPLVATVNVPPLPQQASNWCWAASGQMTMRYFGHDVAQCVEANKRFGLTSCCVSNSGSCNQGGWPEYSKYGFTATRTSNTALTWDQVKQQIYCAKKPVAFSWHWLGSGGHMMVLHGYMTVNNVRYVYINDPEPYTNLNTISGGTEKIITYARYVSDTDHTHWDDFYNITYQGGQ
ncbi:C39 family peptidase [Oleiagrimonas soli]|uniref:Peptidase C39-like domain-containing protein n=1 Tax=Oleiagrimonas soli TaxID=1543381 RepID=A0A099CVL9_9GAMM|nr:papain-like cysteine protease family protein [Oleiagrimonas soli]KGI77824.1 hypothetical protein LF63_0105250 [Oleiagrimonas soli]MBB6183836.1 hypothetical protein [Oleiagrimonas soli]